MNPGLYRSTLRFLSFIPEQAHLRAYRRKQLCSHSGVTRDISKMEIEEVHTK